MATPKMVSPVQGYVSSGYGNRGGSFHAGIDIAGGGKSRPVYAPYAGTLSHIVRGRKHLQPASVGPVVAPFRSGDGGRVKNPDGEQQVFIHVKFLSKWKNGDRVEAGDLLGYTNLSGMTTGYHLHYEEWTKSGKTRNPLISFRYFGVKVGSKPVIPKSESKPAPKPKPKPKPKPNSNPKVLAYQKRQNKYGKAGLYEDGVNGTYTKRWREWVKRLQRALPAWKGVPNLVIDGDYGEKTARAAKIMQERNGLVVDGVIDTESIRYMRKYGSNLPYRPDTRP